MNKLLGLFFIIYFVLTCSIKVWAISPTGQGIFLVNNCNNVVNPINGQSWCVLANSDPPSIFQYVNGSWIPSANLSAYLGTVNITANSNNGTDQINNANVNKVINVRSYGASGSNTSYKCSINASSPSLSCTAPTDFKAGQGVMILGAGIPTPLTVPEAISTVTNLGNAGTTNDCYAVVTADPYEGTLTPSACVCNATGPAAGSFSAKSGLQVTLNAISNSNAGYGIYRNINASNCTGATFVNILGSTTNYQDYGYDMPPQTDWPTVLPTTTQNQALFTTIVSGSGSNWTVATPAVTSVSNATTRHDDTVAINNAINNNPGSEIHFPAGYYHANQIRNYSAANTFDYSFTNSTMTNLPWGHLGITVSNIQLVGDGEAKTHIVSDFTASSAGRSTFWGFAVPGALPSSPLQTGVGTYAFPTCALNNAVDGSTQVVVTTPPCSLNIGDYVWITGGLPLDATYTATFITPIKNYNSTTGLVTLKDPLPWPLPWGSGASPVIMDLTTNNSILSNILFRDMSWDIPTDVLDLNPIYNLELNNIRSTMYPRFDTNFLYSQYLSGLQINNSDIYVGNYNGTQFTVDQNVSINNSTLTSPYPRTAWFFKGGTTPVQITNNTFNLVCASSILLGTGINHLLFAHNNIEDACPVDPSAVGSMNWVLQMNYGALALTATNWNVTDNTVNSNYSGSIGFALSGPGGAVNCLINGNTFYQNGRSTTAGSVDDIIIRDSCQFSNNKVTTNSTGNTTGVIVEADEPSAGANFEIVGNTLTQTGTDNNVGIYLSDPGSPITVSSVIRNNHLIGAMRGGVQVQSVLDTPDVFIRDNFMEGVTTNLTPSSLIWGGIHGLASPTFAAPSTDCGTTPGSIAGSDTNGLVQTGTNWSSCKVTFAQAWALAPKCSVTQYDSGSSIALSALSSTTALTIFPASPPDAAATTLTWVCPGAY